MSNNPFTNKTDLDERARILSACYRLILSWPDPLEQKVEPATDDLGWNAITGSENEYPNIHPDQSTSEDAQETGEQGGYNMKEHKTISHNVRLFPQVDLNRYRLLVVGLISTAQICLSHIYGGQSC